MSAPSTKSFDKTRRAIQKKKRGGKIDALHAFSRDSRRLTEASARDQRLDKLAANRARKEQPICSFFCVISFSQGEVVLKLMGLAEIYTLILETSRSFFPTSFVPIPVAFSRMI